MNERANAAEGKATHFKLHETAETQPAIVNLRCPYCRHAGAFHGVGPNDVAWNTGAGAFRAGMRRCPNKDCDALVFVVTDTKKEVLQSFPAETIDFDSTSLPPSILSTLEEAIKCHAAGCFRAASLMVRRVLEELCEDKNAKGDDLKKRLAALGSSVVVPKELLDAADHLRLLGNDAAHVNATNYQNVGKNEATLAIELAKELLKAVYQYGSLVDQLKKLKAAPEGSSN